MSQHEEPTWALPAAGRPDDATQPLDGGADGEPTWPDSRWSEPTWRSTPAGAGHPGDFDQPTVRHDGHPYGQHGWPESGRADPVWRTLPHQPLPEDAAPTVHFGSPEAVTYDGSADAPTWPHPGTATGRYDDTAAPTIRYDDTTASTSRYDDTAASTGRYDHTTASTRLDDQATAGWSPGPRAGAYRGAEAAGAHPAAAETGSGPAPERRFGPGVPVTPPATPSWPARRRNRWRTLASVLSTLLTLALLAVAGIYLWQRLSPVEVTGVSVEVARPAGDQCDVTVLVVATVGTNGRAGVIRYQWLRTGSPPGTVLTERVGRGQRSAQLSLEWTFTGVGTTRQTATMNIIEPSAVQAQTEVTYDCRRG